ncbi:MULTISPECIES: hypothetical protein [Bacillus]|uniref:Uncharacterized protein n=1 Tax=Bacillus vallismortis TaxID=72361 RepID=A0AAP3CIV8_BACVA|nr:MULTISPECIES: hypothetical protein [Bacillus]MBG9769912.1 hypothetical protein [Bacillus vallismortis]MCI3986107.1 hypothetical protein [Bacillus vallismortis]MCI4136636.1 hypothetical protein [Bacillus vallismortis]MCY7917406.1 hypothetical protein [Bacillus vallismortis]MCY8316320.1 hypothetical protein [Bacillus vallismortis]
MKYNYKFDQVRFKNGSKSLVIILPERIQLVAEFLMSDVQGDPTFEYEVIDKVLNGTSEYEELNGNVCGLEIKKDKTFIYDNLAEYAAEDEDDPEAYIKSRTCEIETRELRQLIEIWVNALKEFREKNPQ